MAAQIFNTLGKLGIGLAVAGGVANSALYNGKSCKVIVFILLISAMMKGVQSDALLPNTVRH